MIFQLDGEQVHLPFYDSDKNEYVLTLQLRLKYQVIPKKCDGSEIFAN